MPVPKLFELTLHRREHPDQPEAFTYEDDRPQDVAPRTYVRFEADKPVASASFPWGPKFLGLLDRLRLDANDVDAKHRVGAALREFLKALAWKLPEQEFLASAPSIDGPPLLITLRSSAAELYSLPWELVTLAGANRHLADLPVLIRYEWPGVEIPEPASVRDASRPGVTRLLFAWSAAGGAVPATQHLDAIRTALGRAPRLRIELDEVAHLSEHSLEQSLAAGNCSILHILCHGALEETGRGPIAALSWNDPRPPGQPARINPDRLARLLMPHRKTLRLVVLCACMSGDSAPLSLHVGSLAQALHRLGIPSVVASRQFLSTRGSIRLARTLYGQLVGERAPLEAALLRVRAALHSPSGKASPEDAGDTFGCLSEDAHLLQFYARSIEQVRTEDGDVAYRPVEATHPFARLSVRGAPAGKPGARGATGRSPGATPPIRRSTRSPRPRRVGPGRRKSGEAPSGLELLRTAEEHHDRIIRLAWSPDGKRLASPSEDHSIGIWDGRTLELSKRLEGAGDKLGCAAWSPDSRVIAGGTANGIIHLWEVESGRLIKTLEGHGDLVRALSWQGERLASASDDGTVKIWMPPSRAPIRTLTHADRVTAVGWSSAGILLATGSDDGSLRIYDLFEDTFTHHLSAAGHVLDIAWQANDSQLAVAGSDKNIGIWDPWHGNAIATLRGHQDMVSGVSFSCDGRLLASKSSRDHTVRLWTCGDWRERRVIREVGDPRLYLWHSKIAFHPYLSMLATFDRGDRVIRLWAIDPDVLHDEES